MTRRVVDGRNPDSPINGTGFIPVAFQHIPPPPSAVVEPEVETIEEIVAKATHRGMRTMYKGYPLRSKLEARWCVFFDSLGIPWDYELEAFEGEFGKAKGYCPDFFLPGFDAWVEVKPKFPSEEERSKCQALADFTNQEVLLIWGYPGPFTPEGERGILSFFKGRSHTTDTVLGVCDGCGRVCFFPKGKAHPCIVSTDVVASELSRGGHLTSVLTSIVSGSEETQRQLMEYRAKLGWVLNTTHASILAATEKARVFRDFFWEPAPQK